MENMEKTWDTGTFTVASTGNKNRIYNALIKSDAVKDKDNLFEVSERMVEREKDNSKKALEELWLLKKTSRDKELRTIDMLIEYYQRKVDSVRQKEERLKNIGGESIKLIEEKKKLQQELLSISQELDSCVQEISFLKAKQEKLKAKEEEIREKNEDILAKLSGNENEVMESLSDIILTREETEEQGSHLSRSTSAMEQAQAISSIATPETPIAEPDNALPSEPDTAVKSDGNLEAIYKTYKPVERSRFPKSIVKTDRGRILGEYYYDPKVYKNSRIYLFNGRYFIDQVKKGLDLFRADTLNEAILNDVLLMANDIQNRIKTRNNILLEISTNEILNPTSLDELVENLRTKNLDAIEELCKRFNKKVEVMGANYEAMLAEQLNNIAAKHTDNVS